MNYLHHLITSKGTTNLLSRALMIYRRFGFTRKKSREALRRIHKITQKHRCTPSFFITAELVDHHFKLINEVSANDTHIGLHGYQHVDHTQVAGTAQRAAIEKGLQRFRDLGVKVSGFRAPFLRANAETAKAASDNGITWVSQGTMLFDSTARLMGLNQRYGAHRLVEEFYAARSHEAELSLPHWGPYCLEIPVSLPDDELLIDRLGIRDSEVLTSIWMDMLDSSRERGELLNFIFHPERINHVERPLDGLLKQATDYGDVWMAPLDDIARWWQQRSGFSLEIEEQSPGSYRVVVNCNGRGSLALQHPGGKLEFLVPEPNGTITVRSNLKPVVAVSPGFSKKDVRCLINEGFVVDFKAEPTRSAFVFDCRCRENDRQVMEALKHARGPLLRFWRWPSRFQSALAITADIDAITFWDFFRRARHFGKVSSRRNDGRLE